MLDDVLIVSDSESEVSVSQIPEYEDPADIQSDLNSSVMRDVPQPGEVVTVTMTRNGHLTCSVVHLTIARRDGFVCFEALCAYEILLHIWESW